MILADTSAWASHYRGRATAMQELLEANHIYMHPMVLGELACGNLPNRKATLVDLSLLPMAPVAKDKEVLQFIDKFNLHGKGVGWVDAHVVCSALISGSGIYSFDKKQELAASKAGIDLV